MAKKVEPTREQLLEARDQILEHMSIVRQDMAAVAKQLVWRGRRHDRTKLSSQELPYFAVATELKNVKYGSRDYERCLKSLKPALKHHYAKNRHHPEHFKDGIEGMNILDVTEMLVDWNAATRRHDSDDHNIFKSINFNRMRFKIGKQLANILWNTAVVILGEEPEKGYEMTVIWGCHDCGHWQDPGGTKCVECGSKNICEV